MTEKEPVKSVDIKLEDLTPVDKETEMTLDQLGEVSGGASKTWVKNWGSWRSDGDKGF